MDRAVNKAAADEQSWPRKGRSKDTALHAQWDRPSWAGELRQFLLPPLPSVLSTRDQRVMKPQERPEGLSGELCEKREAMSPYRCCVKGVQRWIYKYVIHVYEHLQPQLLHQSDGKYNEFLIRCTLRTCQHTPGHKHISM